MGSLVSMDAAFDQNTYTGGIGEVARDEMGRISVACNEGATYSIDAETTEALVIQRALAPANEVGYSKKIIQWDCLEAIETMQGEGFSSTAAAPYYEDICIQSSTSSMVEFNL